MATYETHNRHSALSAIPGKRPSLLMALEPRILFDGAGAEVVADVSADAFIPQDSGPAPEPVGAVHVAGDAVAPVESGPATDITAGTDSGQDAASSNTIAVNTQAATDQGTGLTTPAVSGQENTASADSTLLDADTLDTSRSDSASSTPGTPLGAATTSESAISTDAAGVLGSDTALQNTGTGSRNGEPTDPNATVTNSLNSTAGDATPTGQFADASSTSQSAPDADTSTVFADTDDSTALTGATPLDASVNEFLASQPVNQVVFVDTAVRDYQLLVDGVVNITDNDFTDTNPAGAVGSSTYTVSGSALVVTLGENPLDDISAVLANYQDLNAIHIVSHGGEGELILGNTSINEANIEQYATFLSQLGESLSDAGDLLLYGCKVAADGKGQLFVDHVATITQADVNASTNNTGNAPSGGDWRLEAQSGSIETAALLNEHNAGEWQGTLATHTLNWDTLTWIHKTDDTYSNTYTVDGVDITLTLTKPSAAGFRWVENPAILDTYNATHGLRLFPNFSTNSQEVILKISFSSPVSNVQFTMHDVDSNYTSTNMGWTDKLVVTSDTGTPTLTKDPANNFAKIEDNTAIGTANALSDQDATVNVQINGSLQEITITYGSGRSDGGNPPQQGISIGDISFVTNDPPVANNDSATINEGATLSKNVENGVIQGTTDGSVADTDPDHATNTLVVNGVVAGNGTVTQGAGVGVSLTGTYGHLQLNSDGSYSYIADTAAAHALQAGETGTDTFTYTVKDPIGAVSNTATLTITINGVNDAPVAKNDTAVLVPGTSTIIDVLANDSDAENDPLTVTSIIDPAAPGTPLVLTTDTPVTLASGTTVTRQADGTLKVVIAHGNSDQEEFYYDISDGNGGTSRNTVSLQRDSDGDGVANRIDIDDDNDGILDINEGAFSYYESFETAPNPYYNDALTVNNNNIYNNTSSKPLTEYNGLVVSPSTSWFNFLSVDGSGYAVGPDFAQEGQNFLDLYNFGKQSTLTYTFDLENDSIAHFSAAFSSREAGNDYSNSRVELWQLGTSNPLAPTYQFVTSSNLTSGDGSNQERWDIAASDIFTAEQGTYQLRIIAHENSNIDNIQFTAYRDSDGDGIADHLDIDADNDGITDNIEAQATAGYVAPSGTGPAMVDTDGDGLDDNYDADTANTSPAASGGLTPVDTDSDGSTDVLDADSDNDGAADSAERGDGQPITITSSTDTDHDGLLDIFESGNVTDGFVVNDNNWSGGVFNLEGVPALNAAGTNAVPLTDNAGYTVDLLFRDVNDPPVAENDSATTPEDTPVSGNVLTNDADADGDTLLVTGASVDIDGDGVADTLTLGANTGLTDTTGVSIGSLLLNRNGDYTFTPAANYHSTVPVITYTISDGNGGTDTATLAITVTPVNDPPVAENDSATTPEDTPVSGNVLTNDADADGDTLLVTGASVDIDGDGVADTLTLGANTGLTDTTGVSIGSLLLNRNGDYTFTPAANYHGTVPVITYTISDGNGGTDTATLAITVTPVNDPPVAENDSATTPEDTPVSGNVLTNDADADGDTLLVTGASVDIDGDGVADTLTLGANTGLTDTTGVSIGSLLLNRNGDYTFTPAANYHGTVPVITYTISDGNGGTDTATLAITVTPVNDPPVAENDSATTPEDTPVSGNVLTNDADADGDTLLVTGASVDIDGDGVADTLTLGANTGLTDTTGVSIGSLLLNRNGDYTFTPAANYHGTVPVITYTISDGNGGTDTATLAITVTPVNDPPVAENDSATTPEDTPVTIAVLNNDSDVDGDPLTVTSATVDASQGTVQVNPDGTLNFTPAPDFNGTATITYTISDGKGGTDTATVVITVTPANDPPVAENDSATTPEDTPVTIPVLNNDSDVDGDPLTVTSATVDASQGTVQVNPDGTITFTPAPGFSGDAVITYTISDGHGGFSTATLTVTVAAKSAPEPPDAAPQADAKPPVLSSLRGFGSTGLHALNYSMAQQGRPFAAEMAAGTGDDFNLNMPGLEETRRLLGLDTSLYYDDNWDQLIGTDTRQYIHDTVNHTWERVERWYGTGTPSTELLRYDAIGGAQDAFNGFTSPMESRMLEDLSRLINTILDDQTLTGGGESGLSPIVAESRTLQNQLDRADIMGREMERLSRVLAGENE